MGRKPLGEKARDKPLMIRVNTAEMAEIEAAAEKAGTPPATWAREMLLELARSTPRKKAAK